jgi:sugar/nucleoside kinase (ribokinase family)
VEIDCLCSGILFADVVCTPVEHVPAEGELVVADRIQLGLGGCASNTALSLARLGVRVGVAGCVGDDLFGTFVARTLEAGGVDTGGVARLTGINTATTMVVNVAGQDRRFISSPGANTKMTVAHIPDRWVRRARVFYVGGYLMLPGLETEAMVERFRAARAAGSQTVLDVVYTGAASSRRALELILPETDYFLPNDDEGKVITGLGDAVAQAGAFRRMGARTVVITLGRQGSLLVGGGLRLRAGTYPVEFVGGTGSGDAFDAGFIAGLLAGEDAAGCLRWGSALGASCVRSIGATESVFTRAEAEEFMRRNALEIAPFE